MSTPPHSQRQQPEGNLQGGDEDEAERKQALARLIGIEKVVWVQVEGFGKVHPIANENLDRETEDKTLSVHFLRFELTPVKQGATVRLGIADTACFERQRNSQKLCSIRGPVI